jgi:hypothetical protein
MSRKSKIALCVVTGIILYSVAFTFFASRTTQLTFRVVDASTEEPISGATATREERGQLYYFYRRRHTNDIGRTDASGVFITAVRKSDLVFFSAASHRGACVGFGEHGKIGIVTYRDSGSTSGTQKLTGIKGVITVPLLPTPRVYAQ